MVKSCAICKNIQYFPSSPGYSEYTPGCEASWACAKGVVDIPDQYDSDDLFVDFIETAKSCRHYDPETE